MIYRSQRGRKKMGKNKRTEEARRKQKKGRNISFFGRRPNRLIYSFNLTVSSQFLVAADTSVHICVWRGLWTGRVQATSSPGAPHSSHPRRIRPPPYEREAVRCAGPRAAV